MTLRARSVKRSNMRSLRRFGCRTGESVSPGGPIGALRRRRPEHTPDVRTAFRVLERADAARRRARRAVAARSRVFVRRSAPVAAPPPPGALVVFGHPGLHA